MNKPMTLKLRIGGAPGDLVAAHVGDRGDCENAVECARVPIRRDTENAEADQLERLEAELTRAFAAPAANYAALDAATVIARNRQN